MVLSPRNENKNCFHSPVATNNIEGGRDVGSQDVKLEQISGWRREHLSKVYDLLYARGSWVLPYMGYIDMCRCKGYGFQAVYSGIGYINQSVWV